MVPEMQGKHEAGGTTACLHGGGGQEHVLGAEGEMEEWRRERAREVRT